MIIGSNVKWRNGRNHNHEKEVTANALAGLLTEPAWVARRGRRPQRVREDRSTAGGEMFHDK